MEDREPLVSIVIPVYNGANYMREAIDSALKQTYKNIEIIVVNDGSTDNTREIALSYGDKIRYFEKENGGVSTALNLAIENMKGEYFSWLSHDDIYEPNKIELEIDGLRRYNLLDNPLIVYCDRGYLYSPGNEKQKASMPKVYREEGIYPGIKVFLSVGVFGCELLIPKNYFEKYGMFDTNFHFTQDTLKWFQMLQDNEVLHVSGVLMWERLHEDNKRNDEHDLDIFNLFKYIVENISDKALSRLKCSLYEFCGVYLTNGECTHNARKFFISKLLSMPEPDDMEEKIEHFTKRIYQHGGKEIYLYCAGRRGRMLSLRMKLLGIKIAGISDSSERAWGQVINGLKCVPPKDVPKDALVIVTKKGPEDVVNMLKKKGYDNVIAFDDFMYDVFFLPIPKDKLIEYAKENGWV